VSGKNYQMGRKTVILASGSPRRQEFLRRMGVSFQVVQVQVDEMPRPGEDAVALARRLSQAKARAAANTNGVILAADTVVVVGDTLLGKPRDAAEATAMLRLLRNRWHHVYTAVTLLDSTEERERTVVERSRVHLRDYTEEEIAAYVASGDPMDKAGGYAIQHADFAPVDRVEGCGANVMGLPVATVTRLLRECGIAVPIEPPAVCEPVLGYCCWKNTAR